MRINESELLKKLKNGESYMGWIGVDLDGTLAEYNSDTDINTIGKPIPPMVRRVKKWLSEGRDVRIFTARVSGGRDQREYIFKIIPLIQSWCKTNLGTILEITNQKDFAMEELWDDRCVQIVPNTGERADGVKDYIVINKR